VLWTYANISNGVGATGYGGLSYAGMTASQADAFHAEQAAFMAGYHREYRKDSYLWAPALAPYAAAVIVESAPAIGEAFGPRGFVIGRAKLGGSSFFNINDNDVFRFGWNWKGSASNGWPVVRLSSKYIADIKSFLGLGVNPHIDIWPFWK
jgi:hypothetical protein